MSSPKLPVALVFGLGTSGVAAARLLLAAGYRVRGCDEETEEKLFPRLQGLPQEMEVVAGTLGPKVLQGAKLVVVSPGVAWQHPLLEEARALGLEVLGELELAFRHSGGVPILAVTGSNGKSTVTHLLGQILQGAGLRVGVGANLGPPACGLVMEGPWDALVWEVSSFQLEACSTFRPKVGIYLNLSPDHLDRHGSFQAYAAAKAKLFAQQRPGDWAVLNGDDPLVRNLPVRAAAAFFSLQDPRAEAHRAFELLVLDGEPLLRRAELPLLGEHNVANALAAALACARFGVSRPLIASTLRHARPLPHRHQLVGELEGVRFVDDSKGTNVGAVVAGLAGYPRGSVHLILGGLGKGQDFSPLRGPVTETCARVYLMGAAQEELAQALEGTVPLECCGTLKEAVWRAFGQARAGHTVLLSPACASFDQFQDYAHRGRCFAQLVAELEEARHAQR